MKNNILNGKNALITGATGGLGKEIARELAKQGCNLYLVGKNEKKLKALSKKFPDSHCYISDFEKDDFNIPTGHIEKSENGKTFILDKSNRFGNFLHLIYHAWENNYEPHIDILINCAGVFPIVVNRASSITFHATGDYESCFNVNVKAPFELCYLFSFEMKRRKWGRIVNIGSSSAYEGFADTGLYCASKHALLGLTRSIYKELKPHNIRCYFVAPGSMKTPMGKKVPRQDYNTFMDPAEVAKYIVQTISYDGEMISPEIILKRMSL